MKIKYLAVAAPIVICAAFLLAGSASALASDQPAGNYNCQSQGGGATTTPSGAPKIIPNAQPPSWWKGGPILSSLNPYFLEGNTPYINNQAGPGTQIDCYMRLASDFDTTHGLYLGGVDGIWEDPTVIGFYNWFTTSTGAFYGTGTNGYTIDYPMDATYEGGQEALRLIQDQGVGDPSATLEMDHDPSNPKLPPAAYIVIPSSGRRLSAGYILADYYQDGEGVVYPESDGIISVAARSIEFSAGQAGAVLDIYQNQVDVPTGSIVLPDGSTYQEPTCQQMYNALPASTKALPANWGIVGGYQYVATSADDYCNGAASSAGYQAFVKKYAASVCSPTVPENQESFCATYGYVASGSIVTSSTISTNSSSTATCGNLWWHDSTDVSCSSQKQFCGAYLYQGLKTFSSQGACAADVSGGSSVSNPTAIALLKALEQLLVLLKSAVASASTTTTMTPIQQFLSEFAAIFKDIVSSTPPMVTHPAAACYTFTTNLSLGMTGSGVSALQADLQKDGEAVTANGAFDDQTASAVSAFQEKYASDILTPNNLNAGTGYVGSSTIAKLNVLYGCK